MSMEYQKKLSYMALRQMPLKAEIPDFRLMVGSAESMHSLPITLYKDFYGKQAKALIEPMKNLSAEQVDPTLVGVTYEPDDFVYNTFYLGEPLGGF